MPRYGLLLVLIVLLAGTARLVHLTADPPPDLCHGSLAIYTDEGFKTLHARNRVLYGDWLWHPQDQYRFWISRSPGTLWLHTLWYRLVGRVDLPASRVLHVLVSLLALLPLAATVRRELGDRRALLATALAGGAFVGIMYNRMAFQENLLLPAYTGVLWLLARRDLRGRHWAAAAALLVVGLLFKVTLLYFVLGAGSGLLLLGLRSLLERRFSDPRRVQRILLRLVGGSMVLGCGLYLAAALLPELTAQVLPLASRNPPASPLILLRNLTYVQFTTKLPVLFLLGLWSAGGILLQLLRDDRPPAPLRAATASWLLVGFGGLCLFEGNADRIRYYLFLLPPIAVLAADLLVGWWQREAGAADRVWRWPERAVGWSLALLATMHLTIGMFHQVTSAPDRVALARGVLSEGLGALWRPELLALALLLLLGLLLLLRAGARLWRTQRLRPLVAALLVLICVVNLGQLGRWLAAPPRRMQQIRQDITRRLGPSAVLAGQWAPALTLGTGLRALHLHFDVNIKRGQLRRLAPTHLLLAEDRPEENVLIEQLYPGLVRPEAQLARYVVDSHVLRLYELDWAQVPAAPGGDPG